MNGVRDRTVQLVRARLATCAPVLCMVLATGLGGCGRAAPADDAPDTVYVCSETHELVVGPPQSVPAINPKTGRRTLLRGGYCANCQQWYALPSPDHAAGNPRSMSCRKHNVIMSLEGPIEQPEPIVVEGSDR